MAVTLDRNLHVDVNAQLTSNQLVAVPLLYLDFPDKDGTGPDTRFQKYFAGSLTDITLVNSNILPAATYIGVGGIASISSTEESLELKSNNLTVKLNGIDSSYIALALAKDYYGGDAMLALAVLNKDTHTVIQDPILLFKGFMSILKVNLQDNAADVSLELESILADWERPRVKRYNSGTQKLILGTDRGFDNVADLVNKEVVWGA